MRQKQGGGSMSLSELKDGGTLESLREKIAYQCTGTESSTVCNLITDQTKAEHSCSNQIRQHNSCCISEQNGGGADQNCYYKQQSRF